MKYNLEFLKTDILDEIAKIEYLEKEFSVIRGYLDKEEKEVPFYDRGAIGYYLHNFYNN